MTHTQTSAGQAGARIGAGRLLAAVIVALAAVVLLAPSGAATDTAQEYDKLTASDGAAHDWFGADVSVDERRLLSGAPDAENATGAETGAAYAYAEQDLAWNEEVKLLAEDGAAGDDFGAAISLDGDLALVGAPFDDNAKGVNAGSAYVFVRDASGSWSQEAKLTASDGAAEDRFGSALSLEGDRAVVGMPHGTNATGVETGAAYVFVRDSTGSWTQETKLVPGDGAAEDRFGSALALHGDRLLAGSPSDDNANGQDAGSAYAFARASGSWSQEAKLLASDGGSGDGFGSAVDFDGVRALVGAEDADNANGVNAGSAYVFAVDASGTWQEVAALVAGDGESYDRFGSSVSVDGATALVGAKFADDANGADAGATYVHARDGGAWTQATQVLASDGEAGDRLGAAVSLDGNVALLGAFLDDNENGEGAGSAYVYTPPPPEHVRATAGADSGVIELDWQEADTSQSPTYSVERAASFTGPYTEIARTTDTSYTDTDADQTYYYLVRAETDGGLVSEASNVASAAPRPPAPVNLEALEAEDAGDVDVDWEAPTSEDLSYRLYRSTQDGGPYQLVNETQTTDATDRDLQNRTYYYVVTAVDEEGMESPLSAQASVEPAFDPTTPAVDDRTQNDGGSGGDASDDPEDPTVLAGGKVIHINGTLVAGTDPVDAYGTRISPNATTSLRFEFVAPEGMGLELRLVAPNETVVAEDQAPLDGGTAEVGIQAGPGEHLQAGTWVLVLEHGLSFDLTRNLLENAPGLPATPDTPSAVSGVLQEAGTDTTQGGLQSPVDLPFDYGDERRCHPRC